MMSRTKPDAADAAMICYQCQTCGACIGEWCTAANGTNAHYLHADRFWQWQADGAVLAEPIGRGTDD